MSRRAAYGMPNERGANQAQSVKRAAVSVKVESVEMRTKENQNATKTPSRAKQPVARSKQAGQPTVKVEDIADILGAISLNGDSDLTAKKTIASQLSTVQVKQEVEAPHATSPFSTPARLTRRNAAVSRTPLFLDVGLDAESDWVPATTSKLKGKAGRRIRDPDSDSEAEEHAVAPGSSQLAATLFQQDSPEPKHTRPSRSSPSRPIRSGVGRYLDLEARGQQGDSQDEDGVARDENDRAWREKYYDDSLGSLRDFIVDDDYVSEAGSSDSEAVESSSEEEYRRLRKPTVRPSRPGPKKGPSLDHAGYGNGERPATTASATTKGSVKAATPHVKSEIIEVSDDSDEDITKSEPERAILEDDTDDDCTSNDDNGILHYSPPPSRLLALPDLSILQIHETDSEPEPPATSARPQISVARRAIPSTPTLKTPASKKKWALDRANLAQAIFDELDRKVFEFKLGPKGAGTVLEWNNRLLTTAGQAHSKRSKKADGSQSEGIKIILSAKVLTGEEQILSTVAHEMCHVASWVISNERKNPHGKVFKSWGREVMKARPDIEVTTKHDYQIEYKFQWKCLTAGCGKIYKRHSKSIDTDKQACGRCRGKLEPLFASKKETAFQVYLRENMALAKCAMPGASHGDVMRALSRQWTTEGPYVDHQSHWKALAAAAKP